MKQYIFLVVCLIVLNAGLVGVFFAKDIGERVSMKNKFKFIRVARVVGFVVALLALGLIYFLDLIQV